MSELLVVVAMLLAGSSGVPGLFFSQTSPAGQRLATFLLVFGSVLGLAGCLHSFVGAASEPLVFPWSVPGGEFAIAIDGLSAVFLLPVFLVALLGSVYGLSYWHQSDHPDNGHKLCLFYGLITAGMALVVVARNSILFLFGWEVMALSAFFLVTTEENQAPIREAGWIYLVATHTATLCLFAVFALLRKATDSYTWGPLAERTTPGLETAIFLLALAGFGLKAGIMPLHVWLPGAHAAAPSHVSALMSGVFIKMGIYGLVRVTSFFPHPPLWWGGTLLALGVVSAVLGVVFAVAQHDFKRLLAYHSIENIGIIVMGLGLALLGRSWARDDWIVLGLAAALLHVWNHALFKSLLFLGAGSVLHAVHTRAIDQLGGLARQMPWTALCFLIGAIAICGLPPLNGLVSELFLYLGLFRTLGGPGQGHALAAAALAAPALALVGALALACFVKVYGAIFLGTGRSSATSGAHEADALMLGPMFVLAACCALIGLAPALVVPALDQGIASWSPERSQALRGVVELAPVAWISLAGGLLLTLVGAASVFLLLRVRAGGAVPGLTWDCGYAAPSPRMQYTAVSFGQMLVGLFGWALRPSIRAPRQLPLFPARSHFHSDVPDAVLDEAVLPTFRFSARLFARFRFLQQGGIQAYLLYIFAILLVLLLWH
jgi:hydrogenase-4 component B